MALGEGFRCVRTLYARRAIGVGRFQMVCGAGGSGGGRRAGGSKATCCRFDLLEPDRLDLHQGKGVGDVTGVQPRLTLPVLEFFNSPNVPSTRLRRLNDSTQAGLPHRSR